MGKPEVSVQYWRCIPDVYSIKGRSFSLLVIRLSVLMVLVHVSAKYIPGYTLLSSPLSKGHIGPVNRPLITQVSTYSGMSKSDMHYHAAPLPFWMSCICSSCGESLQPVIYPPHTILPTTTCLFIFRNLLSFTLQHCTERQNIVRSIVLPTSVTRLVPTWRLR